MIKKQKKIGKLSNKEELDQEIKDCLNNLKKFIENLNNFNYPML